MSPRAKQIVELIADIDVRDARTRITDKVRAVERDIPVSIILAARDEVNSWPETKEKRKQKGWS